MNKISCNFISWIVFYTLRINRAKANRKKFWTMMFLLYSSSLQAQDISPLINMSNNPEIIDLRPEIAIDSDEYIHAVWQGLYFQSGAPDNIVSDIFYSNNRSGQFSIPKMIQAIGEDIEHPEAEPKYYSKFPSIAIDRDNNAHIIFTRGEDQIFVLWEDLYYAMIKNDTIVESYPLIFGGYSMLFDDFLAPDPGHCKIFIDNKNQVHVLFHNSASKFSHITTIYHTKKGSGSGIASWTKPSIIIEDTTMSSFSACIDANNHIHITYEANRSSPISHWDTFYTNDINGDFSDPICVNPDSICIISSSLAVDDNGYAHILYDVFTPIPVFNVRPYDACYVNNSSGQFRSVEEFNELLESPPVFFDGHANIQFIYYSRRRNSYFFHYYLNGEFISENIDLHSARRVVLKNRSEFAFCTSYWIGEAYESDSEVYYYTMTNKFTNVNTMGTGHVIASNSLYQNYPNPFNLSTRITYDLPERADVELAVFNVSGQMVRKLDSGEKPAGTHSIVFHSGSLPSGIYYISLKTPVCNKVIKSVLLK